MLAPISGSRRDGKSSFRTLTRYLTEGVDPVTGEIVERGAHLLSDNLLSLETTVAEMRSVAFENPRVTDPVYHYQLCWRPGERPSQAQWEEAARKTIKDLGFKEHQFLVVAHDDREHFHVHVLVNRVHPETYKAHYPEFSKRALDKSLREIEHAQKWKPSPGLYRWDNQLGRAVKNSREEMQEHREKGTPDVGRAAQKIEHFQDAESLEGYAKGTPAKELRELLRKGGQDWEEVHLLLKKHGLELEKAEKGGYAVRAIGTGLRVKASSVFRDNFSGKANREQTEKQLGNWEGPNSFVKARAAEQTYPPQPKRDAEKRAERRVERAAAREKLKGEYRKYRSAAEKGLSGHRHHASTELRNLGTAQRARRAEVRTLKVGYIEKQAIRSALAAESVKERAALKQRLMEERAKHQPKNYREWVAEQAAQGDPAAMSQLRGFLYQDKRRVLETQSQAGAIGIQGAGGGDWRVWSDTFDVTEELRKRKLLTDLQTLQGTVDQRTGHVAYRIGGKEALLDVGKKVYMLDQREATLVAGLEMAVQKFGVRLEITGTDEQKKLIARTAAQHGLRVEFTNPGLQQVYQQALPFQKGRVRERER
ncbi:MAG: relaxase/mobilization nuclease domain-containing protein [Bryobacterales bacterium]|nr:relaxase/mobilization nuclease domain-containing protein [Bryobacterales bacterium]